MALLDMIRDANLRVVTYIIDAACHFLLLEIDAARNGSRMSFTQFLRFLHLVY